MADFSSQHPALFAKANAENMLLVVPQALVHPMTGSTLWTDKPFLYVADDRSFVTNLLGALDAALNVDRLRVYAAGFSNGGEFSHWMGSTTTGLLAAVAAVCSQTGWVDPLTGSLVVPPSPLEPMSMLMVRGGADPERPFNGSASVFSAQQDVDYWVAGSGCTPPPVLTTGGNLSQWDYNPCAGTTQVTLVRVGGMGHIWPDAADGVTYDANVDVIDFLLSHSR